MSREGAKTRSDATRAAGTPIWVWIVYGLGILAAVVFAFSVLFTLGAYLFADDVPVTFDISIPALLVWGALVVLAVVVWFRRRRS